MSYGRGTLEAFAIYAAFAPIEGDDCLVKIGLSSKPLDRIYEIHCSSPFPVKRAVWMYVGTSKQARCAERIALIGMKEKSTRGEWVRLNTGSAEDKALFTECMTRAAWRASKTRLKWNHTDIPAIMEALKIKWDDSAFPTKGRAILKPP